MATEPLFDTMSPAMPSPTTHTTSWASLPFEVRQMILSLVPSSPVSTRSSDSPAMGRFAAVCWEWQVFFERHTFRRLVLNGDSLGEFDTIIRRDDTRLGYIRQLWLRVQLPRYECPDCDEPEDEATQHRNNMIFTTCVQSLLGTLKLWDPARHGAEGLALMLSASSPSDTEHRFNRCEIQDSYPFHYAEDLHLTPSIVDYHLISATAFNYNYFHNGVPTPWHCGHAKRVQGTPLRLELRTRGRFTSSSKSLPAVPIVKGLVMRRQFRRDIHVRTLSRLLDRSFVALEWFRFERTRSVEPRQHMAFDQGFQSHLLPSLPKTLRQLSFTQWELPSIERLYDVEEEEAGIPPHAQAHLPREMAKLSQRLERFCPPWQMDTATFLQSLIELGQSPEIPESSLRRISLRCSLPDSDSSRRDFKALVLLAAKAALSLPHLEVMELWGTCLDGEESSAYIFRYTHQDGRASIVWRGFEEITVAQERIMAKWSEVARKYTHSALEYSFVPFMESRVGIEKSEGTFIYRHLLLKDLVFDPITQIILENEPSGWRLEEGSNSAQQDEELSSILTSHTLDGGVFMNGFGLDADLASLQADFMAFNAEVNTFLQSNGY